MLVAFVIPTYRTYKQTGINPITFGKNDNAHDYIGFIMKVLIVLLFVAVLTYSMSEKMYSYLVPIFLGMIISVVGLFFIVPNALTFFLTITTYIIIQIQIRLEEEFLQKQHAQDYVNYKLKTKRLL